MFSLTRSGRKPAAAVRTAVVASLMFAAAGAHAEESRTFVLTAYSNGAGGADVMAGQYTAAVEEISRGKRSQALYPTTSSTNLCVAHAANRKLDAAREACDAAITIAKMEKLQTPAWVPSARRTQNSYIALAYSNRAVLYWLMDDEKNAALDMAKATQLAPKADFVARNTAAMRTPGAALAQVSVK